jgi:hypothetical protein
MWLPPAFVPSSIARDASSRHLAARLACSAGAFALVALLPGATDALASATGSRCLMLAWLGIPCPGCGITTSLRALGAGNVVASLQANPAGVVVAAVLLGQGVLAATGLWRQSGPALDIHRWLGRLDRVLAGGLGVAWIARIAAVWL